MPLISDILSQYPIQVTRCSKVKDVFRIDANGYQSYCLKFYHLPLEEVLFIVSVHNHLVENHFLYSPRILLNHYGKAYVEKEGIYYIVTNWIDGQNPQFRNQDQLKKSVRTLAHFHIQSKNIPMSMVPKNRLRVFSLEERFKHTYRVVKREYQKSTKSHAVLELCKHALCKLSSKSVQKAILHEANVNAFIHGDYNFPNLVVDTNGNHQLIDFDNTSCHVRMEDLAHIIHRNYPWQAEGMSRLVEVYDQIRPIGKEEFRLLITLMYEPYPLSRAIRQKKRRPYLQSPALPNRNVIERYAKQLEMQI